MERKVRILGILAHVALSLGFRANGQGLVFTEYGSNYPCLETKDAEYVSGDRDDFRTYNFGTDSFLNIPPYAYSSYKKVVYIEEEQLNDPVTAINHEVVLLAKNHGVGKLLHYLYCSGYLFVTNPASGKLLVKKCSSNQSYEVDIGGLPFGLCYSIKRKELYISGLRRRGIVIFDLVLEKVKDSMIMNGNSGRYMCLSSDEDFLFVGTRSTQSIARFNLSSSKLISFCHTGNKPGPMYCDARGNLYFLQSEINCIAKLDAEDLTLFECQRILENFWGVKFNGSGVFTICGDNSLSVSDTLKSNDKFYRDISLDSSGRYTWIVSSYSNPKWALVKMKELESTGITCYLSALHDGHFRLSAGLFENQFDAVQFKDKYNTVLKGSWLNTIHPHKF